MDKTPDQLKLAFALWTRDAERLAIKQLYGRDLPLRTFTDYLKRWGFTPQKPTKRAYEQNPKAVAQWLETTYPQIQGRAKQEKAEIHWGDETGIQNDAYNAKGFASKGKTPVVRINATKSRVNMISSITNRGKVRFMVYRETITDQVLFKFMPRLIKDADRKVFLILDTLKVHHSHAVTNWLNEAGRKEQIEIFQLPSYSPELNPDEYLNADLKQTIRSGLPAPTVKELTKKTRSFMRTLQNRPKRVYNYSIVSQKVQVFEVEGSGFHFSAQNRRTNYSQWFGCPEFWHFLARRLFATTSFISDIKRSRMQLDLIV